MSVRISIENLLLREAPCQSDFFFPFLSERKMRKSTELEEKRKKKDIGVKEDAAMKGPPGPVTLFPLQGECYWCKMALCLSETPAS